MILKTNCQITKIKQKIPKIEQNANMIYFDIVYLEENT